MALVRQDIAGDPLSLAHTFKRGGVATCSQISAAVTAPERTAPAEVRRWRP